MQPLAHNAAVELRRQGGAQPKGALILSTGLSAPQIKDAQKLIEDHIVEIQNAWASHFGS